MKKRINNEYPPLHLLKTVTALRPLAWEQMKDFHDHNGRDGLSHWPEWCYAPIAAAIAVATEGAPITPQNRELFFNSMKLAQQIAALAPWRLSKEVFLVDEDFEALLFEQDGDLDIPSEILLQLPYPCFYMEFHNLTLGHRYHGAFVHLEYDIKSHDRELRFLFVSENGNTWGFPIHIDERSLESNLAHTREEGYSNLLPDEHEVRAAMTSTEERSRLLNEFLRKALQLVLYVCASNAEISPNSEQALITKRSSTIKDRYAEIRKWDVGARYGAAIRQYRKKELLPVSDEKAHGTHASPRPHMRRGHWHNYWTGPKSDPSQRKLVLKWTPPTIIGADEEAPVVLHIVTDKETNHGENKV